MTALTMVNRAVAIAVRVSCDLAIDVSDGAAYAHQVGRRIQGAYGAELRRMADADPDASAQELYEAVILPREFPHLATENPHAEALVASGARDRARHARPETPAPTGELLPDWRERLAEVRAALDAPPPEHAPPASEPLPANVQRPTPELMAAVRAGDVDKVRQLTGGI